MHISMVAFPTSLRVQKATIDNNSVINYIESQVEKVQDEEAHIVLRLFEKTTRTWNRYVEFNYEIENTNDVITVRVWTNDEIYYFIDQGTQVRYATMTDDFWHKTTPGVIGSRQGSGGMLYVDVDRPRPGIESRRFSEEIYKRRRIPFNRKMDKVINKITKKYWDDLWGR